MKVISGSFTITAVEDGENAVTYEILDNGSRFKYDPNTKKVNMQVSGTLYQIVGSKRTALSGQQIFVNDDKNVIANNANDGNYLVTNTDGTFSYTAGADWVDELSESSNIHVGYYTSDGLAAVLNLKRNDSGENGANGTAIILALDNDNGKIVYDNNGNPKNTITSQARLYVNGEEQAGVKFGADYNPDDFDSDKITVNENTGAITISGIKANIGSVKIVATYNDKNYYASITVQKVINETVYDISCSPNAIVYNVNEAASNKTINVSVFEISTSGTRQLTTVDDLGGKVLKYRYGNSDGWSSFEGFALTLASTDYRSQTSLQIKLTDGNIDYDIEEIPITAVKDGTSLGGIVIQTSQDSINTKKSTSAQTFRVRVKVFDNGSPVATGYWSIAEPTAVTGLEINARAYDDDNEWVISITLLANAEVNVQIPYTITYSGNDYNRTINFTTTTNGVSGDTVYTIYKASYSQPSEPTSSSLNGWNETAPSLLEKVEISHGGLWIRESVGLYRSHPDMLNRHNTGIVERFYLDNKNNVDVYMPFLFSASSESYDKGYIFGVEGSNGEYYDVNEVYNPNKIVIEVGGTSQSEGLLRLPASTKSFVEVAYAKDGSQSSNGDCVHIQFGGRPIWECKAEYNPNANTTTYGSVVKTSNFDSRVDDMPQNNIKDNLLNGARFAEGRRDNWILSNDAYFTSGFGKANMIYAPYASKGSQMLRYILYDRNGESVLLENTQYVLSGWTKGTNVTLNLYAIYKGTWSYSDSYGEVHGTDEHPFLLGELTNMDGTNTIAAGSVFEEGAWVNSNSQVSSARTDCNDVFAYRALRFKTGYFKNKYVQYNKEKDITNANNETKTVTVTVTAQVDTILLNPYYEGSGGFLMPKLEAGSYPTEFNVNDQDIAGLTGKLLYPAGVYDASKTYTADEYSAPYVAVKETNESGGDFSYYWLNKESAQGINPITDESNTWKKFNNFQAVYANVLVADFAKIASAVYYQKYMFSQQGVDSDGTASSNYENFLNGFTPNILLDFELGEANFRKINIGGDATFDGVVTAKALYRGITNIRPYALNNEPYYYGMETNNPVIEDFIVIADDQLWQNVPTLAPPYSGAPLYIPEPENYKGKEILIRNGLARSSDVDNKNVNIRITTPSGNATIGEGKFYDTSGGDSLGISTVSGNQYLETVRVVSDGTYWVVFEKVYIS